MRRSTFVSLNIGVRSLCMPIDAKRTGANALNFSISVLHLFFSFFMLAKNCEHRTVQNIEPTHNANGIINHDAKWFQISFCSLSFCFAVDHCNGDNKSTHQRDGIFDKISHKKANTHADTRMESIDGGIGGSCYSLFITQSTSKISSSPRYEWNRNSSPAHGYHNINSECVRDEINSLFMISVCENGAFVTHSRGPTANRIRSFCHENANGHKHTVSTQWAESATWLHLIEINLNVNFRYWPSECFGASSLIPRLVGTFVRCKFHANILFLVTFFSPHENSHVWKGSNNYAIK